MTNDKTVTMSLELAEQFLAGGRQCDREQLRALLDAPSVQVDAEKWYADTPDGDSALVTRVAALCNHPSMSFHQVALLEGAIAESATSNAAAPVVERQPDAVMKLEAERLWDGDGEYCVSFVKYGWLDECRKTGGTFLLYASPPAPVAVAAPKRCTDLRFHGEFIRAQAILQDEWLKALADAGVKVKEMNQ